MVRKRAIAAGAGLGVLVLGVLAPRFLTESPPIPEPPADGIEAQVAEKIAAAREAVGSDRRSGEAWGRLGMVFHAHYLESEAAPCYSEAHRLDPEDFRWPYLLARILKSQDPERALEMLDRAWRLRTDYAPSHLLAAELHEAAGNSAAALDSYRRALSADRGAAAAELGMGRLALARDDLPQSREHLERARELAPEAGSIHAALSQLYHRLGSEEEALRAAGRARRLHPEIEVRDPVLASMMEEAVSLVGYQSRAVAAERGGDPSRAEALLRRAIEIRPEDASLRYNLANHLSRQGRATEAEESYRVALRLNERHVPTLVNLGILEAQEGRLDEAQRLFGRALEIEPAHTGALLGLGNAAAARGEMNAAVSFFERAIESDPERPDAHYSLGRALAARGEDELAMKHFLAAVEGAPEQVAIHLEIAKIHESRGELDAARHHIQLARNGGAIPSQALPKESTVPSKTP